MHALLQNGNFGFDSPFCIKGVGFSGVDISLFSGAQELIPIDGPRTVCCGSLCRCPKRCPFDEKWDEALDGDLETVKARFRDDPSRKNSPPPKNDSPSSAKTFSGLKSGFLNKKRQTPAEQKRSTKPHTAPASSEGISRSELSGIRKGFLLRGRSKEPPNADVISLDSTKPSAQPVSATVDVRPNITKSSISQSGIPEEPRKFRKLRSRVKPPTSLVAEPALEVERPPIQLPEPEVIAPIKCSCCQSNIKPKEEVYYEVECVEDCKLFIHKHCLHNGMTSQNIKKKKELKDARCFTDGCSAVLHTIHQWNMDNSRELYIKCRDKHQPKGDAVSKKHKHKGKRCKSTEKTREKGSAIDSHPPENGENYPNPEHQTDSTLSELTALATAEDDHVADTSPRVALAPELNAVPLLRPKEEAAEKYAVANEPVKQHPRRNKQKKSRGVSISLDLPLFVNSSYENAKQRNVRDQDGHRSDSTSHSPGVHGRSESLSDRRTVSDGNPWQGDTFVSGLEDDVFAMNIDETQEYFPSLTTEEHIVQPLVQIIEPFCRDLVVNTTDLPQPISKLKETIETVVGGDIRSQKKLFFKVFESESLLKTFIRKLGIFTVSRMRGQIYYAKNSFAKHLEQEALATTLASLVTVGHRAQATGRPQTSNASSFRDNNTSGESPHTTRQGLNRLPFQGQVKSPKKSQPSFQKASLRNVCEVLVHLTPLFFQIGVCQHSARRHAWSPVGPSLKTRSVVLDERDCQICLERIGRNRKVLQCPSKNCCEPYHLECIRKWLLCYAICPQCRSSWPDPISFPDMGKAKFS